VVAVGQPVQFTVLAVDPDPGQQVSLQVFTDPPAAPPDPRFDPPVAPANPIQGQVTWTPTRQDGEVGAFRITLVASDPAGGRRKCAVFVTVVLGPEPPLALLEKSVVRVGVQGGPAGAVQRGRDGGADALGLARTGGGAGAANFFVGPTQTPLPGPGRLMRVEESAQVAEAEAASGGVFIEGVLSKTIFWQLEGSQEPVAIPLELPFAGFIPVNGAMPGDVVSVTEVTMVASIQKVLGP